MDGTDLQKLVTRCGASYVSKRLRLQVEHAASILGPGVGSFHFENLERAIRLFGRLVKLIGAWNRGFNNTKAHKIIINKVEIPGLPRPFHGFKILHLSDLHLDVFEGMGAHLGRICSGLTFDVALLTGDFRFHTHSNYYPAFREIESLERHLKCRYGSFGILGNHDFLEFVPKLESHGIRMLLNEAVKLDKDGEHLWIVGIDDAHFYGVHDYGKAFEAVPTGDKKILMMHSPETLDQALLHQVNLVLAGHTHAGQVCLPGGLALWMNASSPRRYCHGKWHYQGMEGYTSAGSGSSGLPIRFNCPPEIIVHHLMSVE